MASAALALRGRANGRRVALIEAIAPGPRLDMARASRCLALTFRMAGFWKETELLTLVIVHGNGFFLRLPTHHSHGLWGPGVVMTPLNHILVVAGELRTCSWENGLNSG